MLAVALQSIVQRIQDRRDLLIFELERFLTLGTMENMTSVSNLMVSTSKGNCALRWATEIPGRTVSNE